MSYNPPALPNFLGHAANGGVLHTVGTHTTPIEVVWCGEELLNETDPPPTSSYHAGVKS